jgi:hypothetical protein
MPPARSKQVGAMCLGHIRGKGFDPVLMVHDFELRAWMDTHAAHDHAATG